MGRNRRVFVFGALASVAAACGSGAQQTGPAGVANAQRGAPTWAAARLADGRCHEARLCGAIGRDRLYATVESCVEQNLKAAEADLQGCSRGVDTARLETCLSKIADASCEQVQVRTEAACTTERLCP
jgi:hypothetical protein